MVDYSETIEVYVIIGALSIAVIIPKFGRYGSVLRRFVQKM